MVKAFKTAKESEYFVCHIVLEKFRPSQCSMTIILVDHVIEVK